MRLALTLSLMSLSLVAQAEAPWGTVDIDQAPALHDKSCKSCHVRLYGGDGSQMYRREGRVLSDRLELLQRVAACNSTVSAGWFPEDEATVAAWLNKRYYHFEK